MEKYVQVRPQSVDKLVMTVFPRGNDERGAALVEFAMIAPLIFALFLGMVTGGLSLGNKNSMTNAVREGARFGATLTESAAWADETRSRVLAQSGGDLTTAQVCVRLVKAPSTVRSTSTGCTSAMIALAPSLAEIPTGDCVVLVWARRTSEMQFVFASRQLILDAKSVSSFERDCS